jgi:valyl-tRNA synthetase
MAPSFVFILTMMNAGTTVGQDLNLSLDRVTANRNFTNKLWNAGEQPVFAYDSLQFP